MMIDIGYKYYFFGSEDSLDVDVLIDHPDSTGLESDSTMIQVLKEKFPEITDWNINIISIENGVVVKSIPSKGTPDSVNNSLFTTYHFHDQKYLLPLTHKVERNLNTAIEKCLTAVFTFYKNTLLQEFYKTIPKKIKNGTAPIEERLRYFERFDFNDLPYDEDKMNRDALKSIAFHIGQTISLLKGIEIYTKGDLISNHPKLQSFIMRSEIRNCDSINEALEMLRVNLEKIKIHQKSSYATENT